MQLPLIDSLLAKSTFSMLFPISWLACWLATSRLQLRTWPFLKKEEEAMWRTKPTRKIRIHFHSLAGTVGLEVDITSADMHSYAGPKSHFSWLLPDYNSKERESKPSLCIPVRSNKGDGWRSRRGGWRSGEVYQTKCRMDWRLKENTEQLFKEIKAIKAGVPTQWRRQLLTPGKEFLSCKTRWPKKTDPEALKYRHDDMIELLGRYSVIEIFIIDRNFPSTSVKR